MRLVCARGVAVACPQLFSTCNSLLLPTRLLRALHVGVTRRGGLRARGKSALLDTAAAGARLSGLDAPSRLARHRRVATAAALLLLLLLPRHGCGAKGVKVWRKQPHTSKGGPSILGPRA